MLMSSIFEKIARGEPLDESEKRQFADFGDKLSNVEALISSWVSPGTSTPSIPNLQSDNVTIANRDVVLNADGILLKNDVEAALSFETVDGAVDQMYMWGNNSNAISIENVATPNGGINLFVKMLAGEAPSVTYIEDPTLASRALLEVSAGSTGGRFALHGPGAEYFFDVRTEGNTGGESTFVRMRETAVTPPASGNDAFHMYMKGDKLIIQANGRYYYLDLTATTNQSWIYSATAP